jgi:SAM-dependent methyltransferase
MWYFHRYFGYQVSGLEYVHWCCDHARALLSKEGITAELIEADLFAFDRQDEGEKWDVVASSGFIEHFSDSAGPLHRHLRLLRRKGYLVILVPNHATVYGAIMRQVAPRKYVTHNRMSLRDAIDALHRAGSCEILFSGYIGRLGFWNCCLYESARQKLGRGYPILRAPLWLIEHAAQWVMPNSSLLSPSFLLIAQKN